MVVVGLMVGWWACEGGGVFVEKLLGIGGRGGTRATTPTITKPPRYTATLMSIAPQTPTPTTSAHGVGVAIMELDVGVIVLVVMVLLMIIRATMVVKRGG